LKLEKSTEKIKVTQEVSCGTCAFFGKPFLCVRKEKNPKATICLSYERKLPPQKKGMYPLLPDIGLGKIEEEDIEISGPGILWYLIPLFFGILGGIVAYIGVKDDDKEMANNLLIFGIVWTIVLIGIYLYILAVVLIP